MKTGLLMTLFAVTIVAGASIAHAASSDQDAGGTLPMSHLPQALKEPPAQDASPTPMTHFDPAKLTPHETSVVPAVPMKIPSGGGSSGAPAVPDITTPAGPDTPGFQTPDHLLEDLQRGRTGLPGDKARYEQAVRDLFNDADNVRDLPGMQDTEVDSADLLGGRDDTLGKIHETLEEESGIQDAGFMPTPTTPQQTPENARGGPGPAPLGPSDPRGSAGGIASTDGKDNLAPKDVMRISPNGSITITRNDGDTGVSHTQTLNRDGTESQSSQRGGSQSMSPPERSEIAEIFARDPDAFINSYMVMARERGYARRAEPDGTIVITRPLPAPGESQDPYDTGGDPGLALWHYQNLYHGPKDTGIQSPNQGPPPGGEPGADSGPPLVGIDLGDDIVVNPDPTRDAGHAREVGAERAAHWRQELEEGAGPGARPQPK